MVGCELVCVREMTVGGGGMPVGGDGMPVDVEIAQVGRLGVVVSDCGKQVGGAGGLHVCAGMDRWVVEAEFGLMYLVVSRKAQSWGPFCF